MKKTLLLLTLLFWYLLSFSQTTFVVTNGNDAGAGSFRQAIADAADSDIITFDPTVSTVTLTSAHISMEKSITINGGTNGVTITRSSGSDFRCLTINNISTSFNLIINNITFTNFKAPDGSSSTAINGGAILFKNYGNLYLNNCVFSQNIAGKGTTTTSAGSGGALYTQYATVFISNCTFTENYAGEGLLNTTGNGGMGGNGGAIGLQTGFYSIENTDFIMNTAGAGGYSSFNDGGKGGSGGAIYVRDAKMNLDYCVFNSNSAGSGGDALNDGGDGGDGGVLFFFVADTVNVQNTDFLYNSTGMGGDGTNLTGGDSGNGGVTNTDGNLFNFYNCTFVENLTSNPGTGTTNNGSSGDGGALYIKDFTNFLNCTFTGNKTGNSLKNTGSGGVMYIFTGETNINRCIFEDNSTGNSTDSYSGDGGVLNIRNSTNIANSLFYNNYTGDAYIQSGKGGVVYANGFFVFKMANNTITENYTGDAAAVGSGGAINNSNDSTTQFLNNIIYNNSIGTGNSGLGLDIFSDNTFLTSNCLITDTLNSKIYGVNNIIGVNPQLSGSFDLLNDSPCLNTGFSDTTGLNLGDFDLAENPRIAGRFIDMGAYEYQNAVTTEEIEVLIYYVSQTESASILVPYTVEGNFESDNIFTAKLSDENGSFENEIIIGTLATTGNGIITGNIPAGILSGNGYRVRVYASNPEIFDIGDNGTDIEIVLISNSISPADNQTFYIDETGTELAVTENPVSESRQWKYSITSGSNYISFSPEQTSTTYIPSFTSEGTFYIICESDYSGLTENVVSNEVMVTVLPIPTYTVNFSVIGANGSVIAEVNDVEINSGDNIEEGSEIVFTATPDENYKVKEWKLNSDIQPETGNEFIYSELQENITVTVEFEEIPVGTYLVNFNVVNGNGTISATVGGNNISTGNTVEEGSEIVFTAAPDENYKVKEWTLNSEIQPETGNEFIYSDIQEDITVTVEFDIIDNISEVYNSEFRIYPNPTKGIITIENYDFKIQKITVNDITGKILKHIFTTDNSKIEIDLSNLSDGIYILKIDTDNQIFIDKIIKQ